MLAALWAFVAFGVSFFVRWLWSTATAVVIAAAGRRRGETSRRGMVPWRMAIERARTDGLLGGGRRPLTAANPGPQPPSRTPGGKWLPVVSAESRPSFESSREAHGRGASLSGPVVVLPDLK